LFGYQVFEAINNMSSFFVAVIVLIAIKIYEIASMKDQIVDSQIAESIFPISKLPNDEKLLVVK
jgi:Tfp pilus assembly major pilin PilA